MVYLLLFQILFEGVEILLRSAVVLESGCEESDEPLWKDSRESEKTPNVFLCFSCCTSNVDAEGLRKVRKNR
jgi:hypothetical protein